MSVESIRFIHASDLHLEQPLYGVTEVPTHLRDAFLDAPYQAAERIFATAVDQRVDFVILAGDVVDWRAAGPRAIVFLTEQFERLAEHGIAVYWLEGEAEQRERWPDVAPLPDTVQILSPRLGDELTHFRQEEPVARIVLASSRVNASSDNLQHEHRLPVVGISYGRSGVNTNSQHGVDYWALGGDHDGHTVSSSPNVAQYCGSPQGRCPDETGPHGAFLVRMDSDGRVQTQTIATDSVRWFTERLHVGDDVSPDDLKRRLVDRAKRLVESCPDRQLLVTWQISLAEGVNLPALSADEVSAALRSEIGQRNSVWTVAVELESSATLPEQWYEEDTILGDYLREVRAYQQDHTRSLEITKLIDAQEMPSAVRTSLPVVDAQSRERILRRTAALGASLLRGEEMPT